MTSSSTYDQLDEKRFMQETSTVLYDLLLRRKSRNKSYSIRAFARDLDLSPAFVSQILSGKRNLSLEQKLKLAERLGIELSQLKTPRSSEAKKSKLGVIAQTLEHEKILKHWYHFAILSLAQIEELTTDHRTTAKRLGITPNEAKTAIQRLISFGYLSKEGSRFTRTQTPFVIDSKRSSHALRELHRSRLFAAEQELEEFSQPRVNRRHYQTLFIPSSKARVQAAKALITSFQDQLISFLMEDADEVFQLSLQLFPVNSSEDRNSKS